MFSFSFSVCVHSSTSRGTSWWIVHRVPKQMYLKACWKLTDQENIGPLRVDVVAHNAPALELHDLNSDCDRETEGTTWSQMFLTQLFLFGLCEEELSTCEEEERWENESDCASRPIESDDWTTWPARERTEWSSGTLYHCVGNLRKF